MQSHSWIRVALGAVIGSVLLEFAAFAPTAIAQQWVTREGRHVRLVTDLPESPQLNELVAAFDAAVPQWAAYWRIDAGALASWRVTAYLMEDKAAFAAQGLIPASFPDFPYGFQAGNRIWVLNQPSPYYTRHLLLHEGTHAVTSHLFGGSGPPWYMEGTAEFLGTHRWQPEGPPQTALKLGIVPASREAAPHWGRVELIARGREQNEVPSIETVMRYGDTAHRDVEAYAWSWLAVALLEMYPEYREPLRAAATAGADRSPQFTRSFYTGLREQWPILAARWRLLCWDIDYGFDAPSHQVEFPMGPLGSAASLAAPVRMPLAVARGWQVAPVKLAAGEAVEISATGRFTLGRGTQPWVSEAEGVTLEYHRGWPLGKLLACVLPVRTAADRFVPPLDVRAIGERAVVTATQESWLLLKVNSPAGELADNRGELQLQIQAVAAP